MSHVSCFTIVRNEELLIARHLISLAYWSTDIVCVVQPSNDATVLIANHVAQQLGAFGVSVRVVPHEPARHGKEYSMRFAMDQCQHDWTFHLDADEVYLGTSPAEIVDRLEPGVGAVQIARWHAIAKNEHEWFKIEPWRPVIRLVDRREVRDAEWGLHRGLEAAFDGRLSPRSI